MQSTSNGHKYDDIIDLPHHVSETRPSMSMIERAAQFSPFAALTGYEAAVEETARLTEDKLILSEDMKSMLDEKIRMIADCLCDDPTVAITYFVPDKKKNGGEYVRTVGTVKQIDEYEHCIVLTDQTRIPIEQVRDIDGELFKNIDVDE